MLKHLSVKLNLNHKIGFDTLQDNQSEISQDTVSQAQGPTQSRNRATSRVSNQSSHRRTSMSPLPQSLIQLDEVFKIAINTLKMKIF